MLETEADIHECVEIGYVQCTCRLEHTRSSGLYVFTGMPSIKLYGHM